MQYQGKDISRGIDMYYNAFKNNTNETVFNDNSLKLEEFSFANVNSNHNYTELNWGDDLIIKMKFKNISLEVIPFINVVISDKEQRGVALLNFNNAKRVINKDYFTVELKVENIQLSAGYYSISLGVTKGYRNNICLKINNCGSFKILHNSKIWHPFLLQTIQGLNIHD